MSRNRKRGKGRKAGKRAGASRAASATAVAEPEPAPTALAPVQDEPKHVAREYIPPAPRAKARPKLAPKIKQSSRPRARARSSSPHDARPLGGSLPILAGIMVIAIGLALALFFQRDRIDPHLIQAESVLERYELGKPEEARDYGHPAYAEALSELSLVDRASPSAWRADALAADIRRRSAEQAARVRARTVEIQERQQLQQQRDEEFFRERRMHPPPAPVPEGPEPEHEQPHSD